MTTGSDKDSTGPLFGVVLLAAPLAAVAAHFVWRDVLVVKLLAIALVLFVLSVPVQGLYASILTRKGTEELEFGLHMGESVLLVLVGVLLAIKWGWLSTGVVFGLYLSWNVVAGLIHRRILE